MLCIWSLDTEISSSVYLVLIPISLIGILDTGRIPRLAECSSIWTGSSITLIWITTEWSQGLFHISIEHLHHHHNPHIIKIQTALTSFFLSLHNVISSEVTSQLGWSFYWNSVCVEIQYVFYVVLPIRVKSIMWWTTKMWCYQYVGKSNNMWWNPISVKSNMWWNPICGELPICGENQYVVKSKAKERKILGETGTAGVHCPRFSWQMATIPTSPTR